MPARAHQLGVDLVDIPEHGPADLRTLWKLTREIKDFRPDLLHAHDYKTNALSLLLGRWFRLPVMTTLHGYVTRGGRLEFYYQLDRRVLRRMSHIVAVSDDLYQMLAYLGVAPSRRSLVENAIDTIEYSRVLSSEAAKERLGLVPGRPVVGAVGRLSPEKGFDILIRACDRLLKSGLDIELLIVGEGKQRPQLEALISELGCSERIRLLGHRSDTVELYQAMDVFVLSSLREGLPNVLLEALALGVPVVATRVAGIPRLIRHEENGLLAAPGAVEDVAGCLARLIDDAALRAKLGRAGRQMVEERYSFEARMEKIRAIYDNILDRTASLSPAGSLP
jgi:glycosyltransferase involved in cell wall biosynthesis